MKQQSNLHVMVTRDSYDQFNLIMQAIEHVKNKYKNVIIHDLTQAFYFTDGKNVGNSLILYLIQRRRLHVRIKYYRSTQRQYIIYDSGRVTHLLNYIKLLFSRPLKRVAVQDGVFSSLGKYKRSDDIDYLMQFHYEVKLLNYVNHDVINNLKKVINDVDKILLFNGRNSQEKRIIKDLDLHEIIYCEASACNTLYVGNCPPVSKERYLLKGTEYITVDSYLKLTRGLKQNLNLSSETSVADFNNYAVYYLTTASEYIYAGKEWIPHDCDWNNQLEALECFISVCEQENVKPVVKPHPNMSEQEIQKYKLGSAIIIDKNQNSFVLAQGAKMNFISSSSIGLEFTLLGIPWRATLPFFYELSFSDFRIKTKNDLANSFTVKNAIKITKFNKRSAANILMYMVTGDERMKLKPMVFQERFKNSTVVKIEDRLIKLTRSFGRKVRVRN